MQERLVPDGSGGWDVVEWRYVYDAWNRLVEVSIDPAPGSDPPEDLQIRARYGYNGLHWRVWRIADEDLDIGSLPDVSNLYYYDAMWRLLEEHARGRFDVSEDDDWGVVTAAPGSPGSAGDLVRITQRVWNLHYIDDLVAWQWQEGLLDSEQNWVPPRRRRLAIASGTSLPYATWRNSPMSLDFLGTKILQTIPFFS